MDNLMKIKYPSSEKVYMEGTLFPEIRVAMRKVNLTPTVTKDKNGEKHFPRMPQYMSMTQAAHTATRKWKST